MVIITVSQCIWHAMAKCMCFKRAEFTISIAPEGKAGYVSLNITWPWPLKKWLKYHIHTYTVITIMSILWMYYLLNLWILNCVFTFLREIERWLNQQGRKIKVYCWSVILLNSIRWVVLIISQNDWCWQVLIRLQIIIIYIIYMFNNKWKKIIVN